MANLLGRFVVTHDSHQTTLIENIEKLREFDSFVDCTFEVEGKYIKAHKVVLAASSIFFSNLFNNCRNEGSVFVMTDVAFDELRATVDFIYRGEVSVPQNQLETFLKVAKALQIKGISGTGKFNISLEKNNNDFQQNFEKNQNNRQFEDSTPESPEVDSCEEELSIVDNLHEDSFSCSSPPKGNSFSSNDSQSSDLEKEALEERICESKSIEVAQNKKIISKPELTPLFNVSSHSVKNTTQRNSKSLDIPEDNVNVHSSNENFTRPNNVFSKDFSNKEDLQSSVWEKREIERFCDTDFGDVNKRQRIPVLKLTRINIDTLRKIKNKSRLLSESSGIYHVKRKKNKNAISDKKGEKSSQKRRYLKNRGPNVCSQCGHIYKLRGSLTYHLKAECGKEPQFECDICKKRIKQKGNLVRHIRTHNTERESNFCPRCKITFKSFQGLYAHSKYICGKEPRFVCDICKKRFFVKQGLAFHMKVHNKEIEKNSFHQCVEIHKNIQASCYYS